MTDLPFLTDDAAPAMLAPAPARKHRHVWGAAYGEIEVPVIDGTATLPDGPIVTGLPPGVFIVPVPRPGVFACSRCGAIRSEAHARRGRNNRKRGGAAELSSARLIGGRKVGPLGHPWDVEMPGYARLQVRKYATPQGLRKIAAELARIGSGAEMPGYIWLEPGRGGEQLIVFRLRDFAERHGLPAVEP